MNKQATGFVLLIGLLLLNGPITRSLSAQDIIAEEVRIQGKEVMLAGTLYIPESCAIECPAMVFLGGGSADTRKNQIPFAERFARKGIVSLIFDKRGAGESTGDYEARTFDNLADDAVSAIRYLAEREETDPARTGLWGGSEGGSVALMAATRTKGVAFVVNLAGPVQHFRAGFLHGISSALHKHGSSEMQRKDLMMLWVRYFEDAEDGLIKPALLADIRSWKETVDADLIPPDTSAYPPEPNSHHRSFWFLHRLPVLENLDMPVFMVYGEYDKLVPAELNLSIMKEAFDLNGQSNYESHVFPRASHAFVTPEGQLVPDFFKTQIDWVLRQVGE